MQGQRSVIVGLGCKLTQSCGLVFNGCFMLQLLHKHVVLLQFKNVSITPLGHVTLPYMDG